MDQQEQSGYTTPSRTQLTVDQYGAFLGKKSERLQVHKKGELIQETPLLDLEQVFIIGNGISLSSDAVEECAGRGIPINFLSYNGQPCATLISAQLAATVQTRREQLLAFYDSRGVAAGVAFAEGKLRNQATLLKYMAKYRHATNANAWRSARDAATDIGALAAELPGLAGALRIDDVRGQLLSIEGRAAERYWLAARDLLNPEVEWTGRETRGATDLVNSLLNYGYGILYSQVQRAVVLAGMDPFAGFVHVDRPGKPSLVLDLIEEFRQMVVDRTVFALLGRGSDLKIGEDGRLEDATRRLLADKVLERLEGEEPHEGKRQRLKNVIQIQARHLAAFLRGDRPEYKAWVGRW